MSCRRPGYPLRPRIKKTDVAERPEAFDHVGLLVNGPPDTRRVALHLVIRRRTNHRYRILTILDRRLALLPWGSGKQVECLLRRRALPQVSSAQARSLHGDPRRRG